MASISVHGQGVLVTGCSSGIGRATALHLAQGGFTVFATVRREADAEALRSLGEPGLVPVWPLDLNRPEHIAPAVGQVTGELRRRGQQGLFAVVNNAGGGVTAPLELLDPEVLRAELGARIVGPVALLQVCLPLLREAGGRIVWITTPALLPIPFVSEHPRARLRGQLPGPHAQARVGRLGYTGHHGPLRHDPDSCARQDRGSWPKRWRPGLPPGWTSTARRWKQNRLSSGVSTRGARPRRKWPGSSTWR